MDWIPADAGLVAGRLALAALLGGLVGLERDLHGRAAGLRTHLLVSLGAAAYMVLSLTVAGPERGDPGRIAAQIVTGIGFLGAGVILKEGINVRGLTTAACLWVTAAVGMAAGGGHPFTAALTTAIALASLVALKAFEKLYPKDYYRTLVVSTGPDVEAGPVIDLVKAERFAVIGCDIDHDAAGGGNEFRLGLRFSHKGITDKRAHAVIASLEASGLDIRRIRWRRT